MKKDFGSVLDSLSKKVHQERDRSQHESQTFSVKSRSDEIFCPGCKLAVNDAWKVCPNCQQQLRCVGCNVTLDPHWKVCPSCNTPVVKESAKTSEPKENKCLKCHSTLDPRWKVCPTCDTPVVKDTAESIQPKKNQCLKCKSTLDPRWKVCPNCDTPVVKAAEENVKKENIVSLKEGHYYTGVCDVDALTSGGIPQKSFVGLISEASDISVLILARFILEGVKNNEDCIIVTPSMNKIFEKLVEAKFPNVTVLLCDPADTFFSSYEKVLSSQLGTTSINLALAKVLMGMDKSVQKRLLIDLNGLNPKELPDFIKSIENKMRLNSMSAFGYLNPTSHSKEILATIVELFDGEIILFEDKISIHKLTGVTYSHSEVTLNQDTLMSDFLSFLEKK